MYLERFITYLNNSLKYFFFLSLCFFIPHLWSQSVIKDCGETTIVACQKEIETISNDNPGYAAFLQKCHVGLKQATYLCSGGKAQLEKTVVSYNYSGSVAPADAGIGGVVGSGQSLSAADLYKGCTNVKGFVKECSPSPTCSKLVTDLAWTCEQNIPAAMQVSSQGAQVSKAANALKNNWKPLLIGAAVGAGAMALMGGKKGGDGGGGAPPPPPATNNKLPDLKLNGSSPSTSSTPSIVYYPPSNNNGSLGNPAVTGSTTSTSYPADTVKIAGITPSTSFSSGQSPSNNSDTSSSRTIGSSGVAAPSNSSAGAGAIGSVDSASGAGGVSGGSGSDGAILVDNSGKSSGGGGSFSGGMDGGSGSGASAQGSSADGTMLSGIPGGKNDPQSMDKKTLASKKAQVAQSQSSTTSSKPLVSNKLNVQNKRLATTPVKVTPLKNLKQDMRERGLIK